jgi:hypothetical protein
MIPMSRSCLGAFALAFILLAQPARADGAADLLTRWFAALQAADATALEPLLEEGAEIRLNDLDLVQTKPEFLASMDEWQDAIDGGTITYRISGTDTAGVVEASVCYRFSGSEQLNKERFTLRSGRILISDQTAIAENCSGM